MAEHSAEEWADARQRRNRARLEKLEERFAGEHQRLADDARLDVPEDELEDYDWFADEAAVQAHLMDGHFMPVSEASALESTELATFHWRLHLLGDGTHPAPERGLLSEWMFRQEHPDAGELNLDAAGFVRGAWNPVTRRGLVYDSRTGGYLQEGA